MYIFFIANKITFLRLINKLYCSNRHCSYCKGDFHEPTY